MINRINTLIGLLAISGILATSAQATKITFDNAAGGNNQDIPFTYGSNIAADSTGFITTDGSGATPNIGLNWVGNLPDEWEYHTATTWVHETPVHVAQIDHNRGGAYDDVSDVVFNPIDGRSVVINSFLLSGATDMGGTATFDWEVVGTAFSGTESVGVGANTGTIAVGFTGQPGDSQTLRFTRLPGPDSGFGTALDDLSFSETLLPSAEVLKLTVTRSPGNPNGNITISNIGSNTANIIGYSITSSGGALDQGSWTTIQGNYDVNGDKLFDNDDVWTVLPQGSPGSEFTEFQFGGDGGSLDPAESLDLGDSWIQTPIEDLQVQIVLSDNRVNTYSVEYVGGPAGGFEVGDLNFDGTISALDWPIYNAGRGADLSGKSLVTAYQMGDLDGDLDNDIADFVLFKTLFEVANPLVSFEDLLSVPEPSSAILLLAGLFFWNQRRSAQGFSSFERCTQGRNLVKTQYTAFLGALLVLFATLIGSAEATTIGFVGAAGVNQDIPVDYGSNISADGTGWTVSDGTGVTPDIGLFWGAGGTNVQGWDWEAHNAGTFQHIEALNAGGAWDALNPPTTNAVAQTQGHAADGALEIQFSPSAGAAVVVNSFDIGNAVDQTAADGTYGFHIELLDDSDSSVVWSHDTGLWGLEAPGPPRVTREESVAVGYTGALGQSYTLTFARLTDPNDPGNGNVFRGGLDNLSFSQDALTPPLDLVVSTTTGLVELKNDSGASYTIDSYEITSASESLDPVSWFSLEESDYEENGSPGTGNGWEEAGGVDAGQLIESYLLGSSTIADGTSIFLGQAFDFDKVGVMQDLQFGYHVAGQGGILNPGNVEYISPVVDADFDNDGDVDGHDFLIWQRGIGTPNALNTDGDANGDMDVDAQDLAVWQALFGSVSVTPVATAVPEPGAAGLFGCAMLGLLFIRGRQNWRRRMPTTRVRVDHSVRLAAFVLILLVSRPALAGKTTDRLYEFGEHPNESAVDNADIVETFDSESQSGSQFDSDAQNLSQSILTARPKYADVGPAGLNRPGASTGQFGVQLDGTDDVLWGTPLNRPDETVGPSITGIGPLIFGFPFNYDAITARGLQMWVYPDASAIGSGRQGIVFDTIAAGGVSITADGKWTQLNDSVVTDGIIEAPVPVVGDQWYHVMHHVYPSASPGAPKLADGAVLERGFTSVVYVDGIAVSANNGNPAPRELDNGDRVGVLAVGAEEISNNGFDPLFDNHFKGVVDDLEMYVFGDNSNVSTFPSGQDYGTFDLFTDNDWIADQIAALPGGSLDVGDINRDGNVDSGDVTALVTGWRMEKRLRGAAAVVNVGDWETWGWGDLNVDGRVDLDDAIVLNDALIAAGQGALDFDLLSAVPEPASIILGLLGYWTVCPCCGRRRRGRRRVNQPNLKGP